MSSPWRGGKSVAKSQSTLSSADPQEYQNVIFELLTHCGQEYGFKEPIKGRLL